jgi:diguanylate cyclase (GGDEF)-like protein
MALREDCSVDELGALIAADPALSMRILGLVNSAAFRQQQEIRDVPRAITVLGLRGLRNLALSLVVSDMVPLGPEGDVLLANCLRRAIAARGLAERLGDRDATSHFTTGLLLDVGLLTHARTDAAAAVDLARLPAQQRPLQERARGGPTHVALGLALAQEFGLPEGPVQAIASHHDRAPPEARDARIAWVAEHLAAVFEGGHLDPLRARAVEAAGVLGLDEAVVDELLAVLPGEVEAAARGFDRDLGPQVDVETLVQDATQRLVEMNQQYEGLVRTLEAVLAEKDELMDELRTANAQLSQLAVTDALTGLPNKRALAETLVRDLSRADRDQTPLGLVAADVDHFKRVNDTYGHAAGDEVLRRLAEVLRSGVRTGDVPARYGGEEFVVVLPRADRQGAGVVAERLRSTLEATEIDLGTTTLRVTASFGVAIAAPEDTPESLFARADAALYRAKGEGRNRVVFAD